MSHLFVKYAKGKEPLVDYSMSNVLVMFNESINNIPFGLGI